MGKTRERSATGGVNHRLKPVFLPIDSINILTQVRRTWSLEYIASLADSICDQRGLLDPIIVVTYGEKLAQEYLELTNRHYKSSHRLSELIRTEDNQFLIVLSGEMRLRAHKHIWEKGCSNCREQFGEEPRGVCFGRHLTRRSLIEARLHRDIPVAMAMRVQLAGNCYTAPPESETIQGNGVHYRFEKELDPKLTIAKFARTVGRSPATMSKYLKVYDLPREIYGFFESGFISSGIAFELAFLKEHGEKDLKWWALRAIVGRMKVEYFHRKVREYLAVKNQGLLDLFEKNSEAEAKKQHIKRTVNREMLDGIYGNLAYWKRVLALFEQGKIDQADSPFSTESPVRVYRQQIALMKEAVLPHLSHRLSAGKAREVLQVLEQVESSLPK